MWLAYQILIHLLAIIGAFFFVILAGTWVAFTFTNPLTGRWLPWVRNLFPWLGDD